MKIPDPRGHVFAHREGHTHSREAHLLAFTELLDAVVAAGKPMSFVYVGATGEDAQIAATRFRGLSEKDHAVTIACALMSAARAGSLSRDQLIEASALVLGEMDRAGWPARGA